MSANANIQPIKSRECYEAEDFKGNALSIIAQGLESARPYLISLSASEAPNTSVSLASLSFKVLSLVRRVLQSLTQVELPFCCSWRLVVDDLDVGTQVKIECLNSEQVPIAGIAIRATKSGDIHFVLTDSNELDSYISLKSKGALDKIPATLKKSLSNFINVSALKLAEVHAENGGVGPQPEWSGFFMEESHRTDNTVTYEESHAAECESPLGIKY